MASGRKNYFRHSFNARKDPKVVGLIDDHGKEAYFHYFALLELCASEASDGFPPGGKFVFRRSTLCHELRVTNSRLVRHLVAIQSALLCELVVTEKSIEILLPNLLKYMGKYETKFTSNSPNKIKEKEIKEKEIKENSKEVTPEILIDLFNLKLGGVGSIKATPGYWLPPLAMDDYKLIIGYSDFQKIEKWREYFEAVSQSDFLIHKLKPSLSWLLKPDNAFKVLGGQYQNDVDRAKLADEEAMRLSAEKYKDWE